MTVSGAHDGLVSGSAAPLSRKFKLDAWASASTKDENWGLAKGNKCRRRICCFIRNAPGTCPDDLLALIAADQLLAAGGAMFMGPAALPVSAHVRLEYVGHHPASRHSRSWKGSSHLSWFPIRLLPVISS